jgi:hypothetical protein
VLAEVGGEEEGELVEEEDGHEQKRHNRHRSAPHGLDLEVVHRLRVHVQLAQAAPHASLHGKFNKWKFAFNSDHECVPERCHSDGGGFTQRPRDGANPRLPLNKKTQFSHGGGGGEKTLPACGSGAACALVQRLNS